ncbi:DNA repair protein RecO [Alphaproteobacteria bacterium]|nr:DNA repair protein RecO [Alphaproteobacteria bacterium]
MRWGDKGLVVSVKKYGENSLILHLFTKDHGVHAGLVKYSTTKKNGYIYELGNILSVEWTGRLEEQLGFYKSELEKSYLYNIINNSLKLDALNSICSMLSIFLPERQVNSILYQETIELIKYLNNNDMTWVSRYVQWELFLLSELGYGLDLSQCAVTGEIKNLKYVSPKSGRAVSELGAGIWVKKLLILPKFLQKFNTNAIDNDELNYGIKLTTFFLNRYVVSIGLKLPESRDRFTNKLKKLNI